MGAVERRWTARARSTRRYRQNCSTCWLTLGSPIGVDGEAPKTWGAAILTARSTAVCAALFSRGEDVVTIALAGRKAAAFGFFAAAACGAANADPARLTADSGRELRLAFVSEVNVDCTPAGTAVISTVNSPLHGQLRVQNERGFTSFTEDSPRYTCNQRRVAGVGVYYTSDRGYTGEDNVTLHYGFPDGEEATGDFVIVVK